MSSSGKVDIVHRLPCKQPTSHSEMAAIKLLSSADAFTTQNLQSVHDEGWIWETSESANWRPVLENLERYIDLNPSSPILADLLRTYECILRNSTKLVLPGSSDRLATLLDSPDLWVVCGAARALRIALFSAKRRKALSSESEALSKRISSLAEGWESLWPEMDMLTLLDLGINRACPDFEYSEGGQVKSVSMSSDISQIPAEHQGAFQLRLRMVSAVDSSSDVESRALLIASRLIAVEILIRLQPNAFPSQYFQTYPSFLPQVVSLCSTAVARPDSPGCLFAATAALHLLASIVSEASSFTAQTLSLLGATSDPGVLSYVLGCALVPPEDPANVNPLRWRVACAALRLQSSAVQAAQYPHLVASAGSLRRLLAVLHEPAFPFTVMVAAAHSLEVSLESPGPHVATLFRDLKALEVISERLQALTSGADVERDSRVICSLLSILKTSFVSADELVHLGLLNFHAHLGVDGKLTQALMTSINSPRTPAIVFSSVCWFLGHLVSSDPVLCSTLTDNGIVAALIAPRTLAVAAESADSLPALATALSALHVHDRTSEVLVQAAALSALTTLACADRSNLASYSSSAKNLLAMGAFSTGGETADVSTALARAIDDAIRHKPALRPALLTAAVAGLEDLLASEGEIRPERLLPAVRITTILLPVNGTGEDAGEKDRLERLINAVVTAVERLPSHFLVNAAAVEARLEMSRPHPFFALIRSIANVKLTVAGCSRWPVCLLQKKLGTLLTGDRGVGILRIMTTCLFNYQQPEPTNAPRGNACVHACLVDNAELRRGLDFAMSLIEAGSPETLQSPAPLPAPAPAQQRPGPTLQLDWSAMCAQVTVSAFVVARDFLRWAGRQLCSPVYKNCVDAELVAAPAEVLADHVFPALESLPADKALAVLHALLTTAKEWRAARGGLHSARGAVVWQLALPAGRSMLEKVCLKLKMDATLAEQAATLVLHSYRSVLLALSDDMETLPFPEDMEECGEEKLLGALVLASWAPLLSNPPVHSGSLGLLWAAAASCRAPPQPAGAKRRNSPRALLAWATGVLKATVPRDLKKILQDFVVSGEKTVLAALLDYDEAPRILEECIGLLAVISGDALSEKSCVHVIAAGVFGADDVSAPLRAKALKAVYDLFLTSEHTLTWPGLPLLLLSFVDSEAGDSDAVRRSIFSRLDRVPVSRGYFNLVDSLMLSRKICVSFKVSALFKLPPSDSVAVLTEARACFPGILEKMLERDEGLASLAVYHALIDALPVGKRKAVKDLVRYPVVAMALRKHPELLREWIPKLFVRLDDGHLTRRDDVPEAPANQLPKTFKPVAQELVSSVVALLSAADQPRGLLSAESALLALRTTFEVLPPMAASTPDAEAVATLIMQWLLVDILPALLNAKSSETLQLGRQWQSLARLLLDRWPWVKPRFVTLVLDISKAPNAPLTFLAGLLHTIISVGGGDSSSRETLRDFPWLRIPDISSAAPETCEAILALLEAATRPPALSETSTAVSPHSPSMGSQGSVSSDELMHALAGDEAQWRSEIHPDQEQPEFLEEDIEREEDRVVREDVDPDEFQDDMDDMDDMDDDMDEDMDEMDEQQEEEMLELALNDQVDAMVVDGTSSSSGDSSSGSSGSSGSSTGSDSVSESSEESSAVGDMFALPIGDAAHPISFTTELLNLDDEGDDQDEGDDFDYDNDDDDDDEDDDDGLEDLDDPNRQSGWRNLYRRNTRDDILPVAPKPPRLPTSLAELPRWTLDSLGAPKVSWKNAVEAQHRKEQEFIASLPQVPSAPSTPIPEPVAPQPVIPQQTPSTDEVYEESVLEIANEFGLTPQLVLELTHVDRSVLSALPMDMQLDALTEALRTVEEEHVRAQLQAHGVELSDNLADLLGIGDDWDEEGDFTSEESSEMSEDPEEHVDAIVVRGNNRRTVLRATDSIEIVPHGTGFLVSADADSRERRILDQLVGRSGPSSQQPQVFNAEPDDLLDLNIMAMLDACLIPQRRPLPPVKGTLLQFQAAPDARKEEAWAQKLGSAPSAEDAEKQAVLVNAEPGSARVEIIHAALRCLFIKNNAWLRPLLDRLFLNLAANDASRPHLMQALFSCLQHYANRHDSGFTPPLAALLGAEPSLSAGAEARSVGCGRVLKVLTVILGSCPRAKAWFAGSPASPASHKKLKHTPTGSPPVKYRKDLSGQAVAVGNQDVAPINVLVRMLESSPFFVQSPAHTNFLATVLLALLVPASQPARRRADSINSEATGLPAAGVEAGAASSVYSKQVQKAVDSESISSLCLFLSRGRGPSLNAAAAAAQIRQPSEVEKALTKAAALLTELCKSGENKNAAVLVRKALSGQAAYLFDGLLSGGPVGLVCARLLRVLSVAKEVTGKGFKKEFLEHLHKQCQPVWQRFALQLTPYAAVNFFPPSAAQIALNKRREAEAARRPAAAAVDTAPAPALASVQLPSELLSLIPLLELFVLCHNTDEEGEQQLIQFAETHRKPINAVIKHQPSLLSRALQSLLRLCPQTLDFDNKRQFFRGRLKQADAQHHNHAQTVRINVRRAEVFLDSYHQLQHRRKEEMRGKLNVTFVGEEGIDAGGLIREWFGILAREIFNPNYGLFLPCSGRPSTFVINPASGVNPDHLHFFRFCGRVIGKAVYDNQRLDCYFTRSFYKHMLGQQVHWQDLENLDPDHHKGLKQLLEYSLDDLGLSLTFTIDLDRFGEQQTVELRPGGADQDVTDENKHEYVQLVAEYKMTHAIKSQLDAFLQGFHDIVPSSLLGSLFDDKELELLISGLPSIDIADLKANTEYVNYTADAPQIKWFWSTLEDHCSPELLAQFLQFVTGSSQVPLDGFQGLAGMNGPQRFSIHRAFGSERLPTAHTCFNQLDLPEYADEELLRRKLLQAVTEAHQGFGFA